LEPANKPTLAQILRVEDPELKKRALLEHFKNYDPKDE
jgi:hypothetical protein